MRSFPFATIGFDLDGTLLDTSGDLAAAVNHALVAGGREQMAVAELMPLVGGGARHLLVQALARSGGAEEGEVERLLPLLLAYYEANIDTYTRPFPQAISVVDALRGRGVTCAVVTNKREAFARPLLQSLGLLDRFACVIGGDTLGTGRAKPAPDMLLAMLEQCGGPAAFVGDSAYDVQAARGAGLPVVVCSFGFSPVAATELGADAVIDGFDALIPTLERLGAT